MYLIGLWGRRKEELQPLQLQPVLQPPVANSAAPANGDVDDIHITIGHRRLEDWLELQRLQLLLPPPPKAN